MVLVLELQVRAAICCFSCGCWASRLRSYAYVGSILLTAIPPVPTLICYAFVYWELLSCGPSLGVCTLLATFTSSKPNMDLPSVGSEMVLGHSRNWVSDICLSALLSDLNIQQQHFCPLLDSYLPIYDPSLCL